MRSRGYVGEVLYVSLSSRCVCLGSRGVRCDFAVACSCANVEWWNLDRWVERALALMGVDKFDFVVVVEGVSVSRTTKAGR